MWQRIRDKEVNEVARDDKRWQGMGEGWRMDGCHLPIGHWSCPMKCKGLSDASSGFWKTSRESFKQGKKFLKR